MRLASAHVLALPWLAAGCLQTAEPPAEPVALHIELRDFGGSLQPRQRAPRRPVIALTAGAPLSPLPDSILVLPAPGDASALLEDLSRPPLRAEHREQTLRLLWQGTAPGAVLTPERPLAAATQYVVAVASWARAQPDRPLVPGGEPLLWPFRTGDGASAGAGVVAAFPADGSSGVGTNLEHAVIALDGELLGLDSGVWLEAPDGLAVEADIEAAACREIAPAHAFHDGAFCVRLRPLHRLAPSAAHSLVIGHEASDAQGAPVGPWRARFHTSARDDLTPPALLPLACAIDETAVDNACALVDDDRIALRIRCDEPVVAKLGNHELEVAASAPRGEALLSLRGLGPGRSHALHLQLRDAAGNTREHELTLATHDSLPKLSIVEVRPDPEGSEPQQELVELLNYGERTLSLQGVSLDDRLDRRSDPIARGVHLLPGARVVLVADDFDPDDSRDEPPVAGAQLIRMGRSLASSGLRNSGEALYLRDAEGRRLSAAPESPRPRPGVCLIRVSGDMRDGSDGSFTHDPDGSCTPGE